MAASRARRYFSTTFATYSGPFMRPSILKQETPAASSSGSRSYAARSRGESRYLSCSSPRAVSTPAVDHQVVRHPAALGALAAVRAALLQGFARQALPAPAHAQRSVHEALQLQVGAGGHGADLLDGELARQHHAGDPEGPGDLRRLRRRDRHL